MGFFSSKPKEEKLPLFATRGRNESTGKKENYLSRYCCDRCDGLFRSQSAMASHKCNP